jgi:hypothetical protein
MQQVLEKALAQIATLPDAEQEQIGRQLLSHIEKLQRLRQEIDEGTRSLDVGEGSPLDVEEFLKQQRIRNGAP